MAKIQKRKLTMPIAGKGPLVNASPRAAKQADWRIKLYAAEKNPNAVVTLENWQFEE